MTPRPSLRARGPVAALVLAAAAALASPAFVPVSAVAQDVAMERGVTGTALRLRQLDGVKRVLLIGAHPDDEDTSLLTALARGEGARTAYLSLTRGDGGQNLIGPELFEGLGVVRTGELVAARALDGGEQYFTRAFDFGYSKSAEEALDLWPREELLRDVVWVVRTFRPQVIVSIFSGTPADGHGQHQAAGIMAREAFEAAADPARYPELAERGAPPSWRAAKLYRLLRRGPDDAVEVETGDYDPVLGRSHYQLAMDSRSQHRSQDMGTSQPLGPRTSSLVLVGTAPGVEAAAGDPFWAGVDTTLAGLATPLSRTTRAEVESRIREYREALAEARATISGLDPAVALAPLGEARVHLLRALEAAEDGGEAGSALARVARHRMEILDEALLAAAGVTVRARVADGLAVPGDTVAVEVEVWNGGPAAVAGVAPELSLPEGWGQAVFTPYMEVSGGDEGPFGSRTRATDFATLRGDLAPGELGRWLFRVAIPGDAEVSRLYYREQPRDGAMYRWPADAGLWGLPRDPTPVHARVALSLGAPDGVASGSTDGAAPGATSGAVPPLEVRREARYVGVDKALGEFTEPFLVVPAVSVSVTPGVMVWPASSSETRPMTVELTAASPAEGTLTLRAPEGFAVEPAAVDFSFDAAGQARTVPFEVTPTAAGEGRHEFTAVATLDDGRSYDEGYTLIDYPHIQRTAFFEPAVSRVTVVPVRVAEGLRVGYVMGTGDDGMEALRQLGVEVEALGPERVRAGDFAGLDALVLGIRAYETRPDLVAANDRILEFAREGGTVVVQYSQYEYGEGGHAPYPVSMRPRAPRVTDEHSPVEFVDPDSPLVTWPNELGPADFDGWVQERGLYFLGEWDERYRPQLALTDPGEEPELGSLLVAPVGEGLYIYAALSFFRQFPAGVPGAYRLFANLVSQRPEDWTDRP